MKMINEIKCLLIMTVFLVKNIKAVEKGNKFAGNPYSTALLQIKPCADNRNVTLEYEAGLSPEEETSYRLFMFEELRKFTNLYFKFDAPAIVKLTKSTEARISLRDELTFRVSFFVTTDFIELKVKGVRNGVIPYLTSLKFNNLELCEEPINPGYLDHYFDGEKDTAQTSLTIPDDTCGRRKVVHTELITNGFNTKPGDWPWHVAIYRRVQDTLLYKCGGTLISNTIVLTAAHCVTQRGEPFIPEVFGIVLGKFNLIGGDTESQEREVYQITVHEEFDHRTLNNDIATMKLKTAVVFSDYVQPACVWSGDNKDIQADGITFGTVAGWGYDHTNNPSSQLRQATMPIISESTCIKSNPVFFSKLLNDRKFCSGYRNGTSACNGDSGGGFMVFLPDKSGAFSAKDQGTWHVKGIVSLAVAQRNIPVCDPTEYVLFTDVTKFTSWINKFL